MAISFKKELKNFFYVLNGFTTVFANLGLLLIIWGVISLDKILDGKNLELFKLGNLPIPSFLGAEASNVEVFIFCVFGVIAIFVGLIRRYLYLRDEIDMMRKLGIKYIEDLRTSKTEVYDDIFDDD